MFTSHMQLILIFTKIIMISCFILKDTTPLENRNLTGVLTDDNLYLKRLGVMERPEETLN
jgi:hypothetical protein